MSIASEFLVNREIEIRMTKMKKVPNKGGVPKIKWKIYLGPRSLKIIQFIQFTFL